MSGKYFKVNGRYYYSQGCQFPRTGPDHEVGAIVVDVTGLPDISTIELSVTMRTRQVDPLTRIYRTLSESTRIHPQNL